nr:MAG TPA: hypothetical protein [Caudoviricetes sp.]
MSLGGMTSERTGRGSLRPHACRRRIHLRRDRMDVLPGEAGAASEAVPGIPRKHLECWREMGR